MAIAMGAKMTPEITSGIIYAHTSETCQRSHYTNSGGHPVELYVLMTKSILFSDREGCRFPCLEIPRRADPCMLNKIAICNN